MNKQEIITALITRDLGQDLTRITDAIERLSNEDRVIVRDSIGHAAAPWCLSFNFETQTLIDPKETN